MFSIHIIETVHCLLRPELWIDCSMRCGRRVQVIPFCSVAHSTPSLRPLVKNGRLTGVVCLLGEFCVACGANAWLGNGKARHQPPDRRPMRGLQGLAGLRADAPSEARGAGGERAGSGGGRRSVGAVAGRRSGGAMVNTGKQRGSGTTDTKNRRPVGHRLSVRHGGLEPSTR